MAKAANDIKLAEAGKDAVKTFETVFLLQAGKDPIQHSRFALAVHTRIDGAPFLNHQEKSGFWCMDKILRRRRRWAVFNSSTFFSGLKAI